MLVRVICSKTYSKSFTELLLIGTKAEETFLFHSNTCLIFLFRDGRSSAAENTMYIVIVLLLVCVFINIKEWLWSIRPVRRLYVGVYIIYFSGLLCFVPPSSSQAPSYTFLPGYFNNSRILKALSELVSSILMRTFRERKK